MRLTGARVPALDGLRGVAILMVLLGHAGPVALQPVAWVGVVVFFALSGYLITDLLLEERASTGSVRLGAFWARRARRLLPALVVMVAATAGFAALVGIPVPSALPVFGYVANWTEAGGGDLAFWNHTWSLAIEEQFYIAWPLLLIVLGTRRKVAAVALVGATVSLAACWWFRDDWQRVYHGTDTRVWAILLGAAFAASSRRTFRAPAWLSGSVLRWFGLRSYGIYLWHYPLLFIFGYARVPAVVAILLALPIAEVSWRWVERPFLRPRPVLRVAADDAVGAWWWVDAVGGGDAAVVVAGE